MIFYKDANGIWRSEKDLRNAYNICSRHINKSYSDFIRDFDNDPIFETKNFDHEPTVIEYLKMNRTIDAIYRYRELHKCDLRTAKDMVDKIREDMHKMEKFGTLKKPAKKRKVHKDA